MVNKANVFVVVVFWNLCKLFIFIVSYSSLYKIMIIGFFVLEFDDARQWNIKIMGIFLRIFSFRWPLFSLHFVYVNECVDCQDKIDFCFYYFHHNVSGYSNKNINWKLTLFVVVAMNTRLLLSYMYFTFEIIFFFLIDNQIWPTTTKSVTGFWD